MKRQETAALCFFRVEMPFLMCYNTCMEEKGDELMKKYDVLKQIKEEKIVGIIRVDSVEKAEKTLDALYEG